MRRCNFDYPNTCPKIDSAIGDAKRIIENFLVDLIAEVCPYIPERELKKLADDNAAQLYRGLEDAFEEVRTTNEDMRDEADRQIGQLKDELESLGYELKEARSMLE